jgi:trans-aconitate methyltransferase
MIVEQFSDKSKPLIDVGCSTGNFLGLVKQSPKLNLMNLLGIDLSTESVAEAQKNFPEIKFSIANMLKLHQKLGFMFLGGQILSLTLVYRILTIQSLVKQ